MSLPAITPGIVADVRDTLQRMAPDAVNKPALLAYLSRPGPYHELRTVLRALARQRQPGTYLEIGVRRGWSLAQVAAECPACDITACDAWVADYGGVPNPGERFVRDEVAAVVPQHRGALRFLAGSSRAFLPELVRQQARFDLITVDGDHTAAGASADLRDGLALLAFGGALVCDDLVDFADDGGSLLQVWRELQGHYAGFVWHALPGLIPVGVVERLA
jgi:predicted O-methyltransferase YrrM